MIKIVFSLVLYKQKIEDILPLLNSIKDLNGIYKNQIYLSIYDNTKIEKRFTQEDFDFLDYPVAYIHDPRNIGFGKANNFNFSNYKLGLDDLFIISNPDTFFDSVKLANFIKYFLNQKQIVCANPLIRNIGNSIQYSSKKNPTFFSLLIGFFPFLLRIRTLKSYDYYHKNKKKDYTKDTFQASFLSGSFLVVRPDIFKKVGGFSDSYFLHLEDADLVRKCSEYGVTAHLPKGEVVHKWNRGSHKSVFQIAHVVRSMIIYFYLWGFEFI